MQDGEDLATFIEEQRMKLAYDRDRLKNNPPSSLTNNSFNRQVLTLDKENQVPSDVSLRGQPPVHNASDRKPMPIQTAVRPPSTPRIFRLGDDYKKRKEKLQEELREDYRNAIAQKNLRTGRRQPVTDANALGARSNSDLGLSLPLKDRLSAKERMKLQRNKEYNEFLLSQEELERQRRAARSLSRSPVRAVPAATPVTKYFAPPNTNNFNSNVNAVAKPSGTIAGVHQQPSTKDANTETYEQLLQRKRQQEKSYRGIDHEEEHLRDKPDPRYRDEEPDDGYYSQRRVRFPHKSRRYDGRGSRPRRSDDYVDYDEDEGIDYRSHHGRRRGRQRRRVRRYDSEEDSDFDSEEEEERLRRRRRNISLERQQVIPSFQREETTVSLDAPVRKSKPVVNNVRSRSVPPDDNQEYTGLPVGQVPSANTVQRRKQQYRDELLEQMEHNKRQKQKEKELDRISGASAAHTDALGTQNNRKKKDTNPPKRPANSEFLSTKERKIGKRASLKIDDSSDEEDGDLRYRNQRPRYPPVPYLPQLPPPPPPHGYYPSPYPGPYGDPYAYYGARNPLDPATSYGAPPAMYSDVSPLLAATGMHEETMEGPKRSKKSVKINAPTRRSQNDSSLIADEDRDKERKKLQTIEYQEELKQQMVEKERQKAAAKQELDRYNMKIEEEARHYNPWGKGGGGAPMKDRQGNLISDLRQMHLENEQVLRDPDKAQEVVIEKLPQTNLYRREERPVIDLSPRKSGGALSPQFGRSNPFEMRHTDEQRSQQDTYKEYLQKQIEEKKRLEMTKKEKERIEDEKEEKRLEEQRKKIQAELEAELNKEKRKQEAARQKNEELRVQAEEKRKEEQERKRKQEDEQRQQKEEELNEKLRRAQTRSPPVPALRNLPRHDDDHQQEAKNDKEKGRVVHTPRQQVVHTPAPQTYRVLTPPQKDTQRINVPSRGDSKRISRELSALRNQLRSEQRRVEDALKTVDQPPKPNNDYLIDLSKARQKPVTVRRPPTVDRERPDSSALEEFTAYKHRPDDTASIRMFRAEYPDSPDDAVALERQQRAMLAQQDRKLEDLRTQALMGQRKVGKQKPQRRVPQKVHSSVSPSVVQSRASLLDADTEYLPINEDEDDTRDRFHYDSNQSSPPQSRQNNRRPSARERRRNRRPPSTQGHIPVHRTQSDNFSLNSISSLATLDVDRIANKNSNRLDKLRVIQGDDISLTDPDDILDRFIKQKSGRPPTNEDGRGGRAGISRYRDFDQIHVDSRPPSVNTLDTEPWLRPETGPTVA